MSAAPPRWGKQPGSGPPPAGTPPSGPARRPPLWRSWKWWIFLGGLLVANILIANFAPGQGGTHRVTIPYSTFKAQVTSDNVVDDVAQVGEST